MADQPSTITIADLLSVVGKLSPEQFEVFKVGFYGIVEHKREVKNSQARAFFDIGDQVTFDAGSTKGVKIGQLVKINQKTAKVRVKTRRILIMGQPAQMIDVTWTVPLSLLRAAPKA